MIFEMMTEIMIYHNGLPVAMVESKSAERMGDRK